MCSELGQTSVDPPRTSSGCVLKAPRGPLSPLCALRIELISAQVNATRRITNHTSPYDQTLSNLPFTQRRTRYLTSSRAPASASLAHCQPRYEASRHGVACSEAMMQTIVEHRHTRASEDEMGRSVPVSLSTTSPTLKSKDNLISRTAAHGAAPWAPRRGSNDGHDVKGVKGDPIRRHTLRYSSADLRPAMRTDPDCAG